MIIVQGASSHINVLIKFIDLISPAGTLIYRNSQTSRQMQFPWYILHSYN